MHRILLSVTAFSVLLGNTLDANAAAPNNSTVVVQFSNGKKITQADLKKLQSKNPQLAEAPFEMIFGPLRGQAITEYILDITVNKDATLTSSPEFKKAQEVCLQNTKREVFMNKALAKKVTPAVIKQRYKEFADNFNGQEAMDLKHILVKDSTEAKNLITQLNNGANFDDLAKKHSLDPNSKAGKTLGMLPKDSMPAGFGDAAFKLKVGEYSAVPVESDFGFHVIKAVAKGKAKAPSFETIKPELEAALMQEALQTILMEMVESNDPNMKLFEIDGTPTPTQKDIADKAKTASKGSAAVAVAKK